MKVAALDLGTNTFLCLIAEVKNGKIEKVYSDQVEVVRLGQEVNQTKRFHPQALERAKKTLTGFSKQIQQYKPEKILAMATSAARDATNADELFKICRDLNIPVEIIPGSKEAEITFKGSISGLSNENRARIIVDVGGGSTEIIKGTNDKFELGKSLDIGCVRLTEMFIPSYPIPDENIKKLKEYIRAELKPLAQHILQLGKVDQILAVAGTPTEIAKVEIGLFDPEKIDGYRITKARLNDWAEKFSRSKVQEITQKFGISTGRADVIFVGVTILSEVCDAFSQEEIIVSTRGVRFGIALELEQRG